MDEIGIEGLLVRTEVGFSPHELGKLQELRITILMKLSLKKSGDTDQVQDTVDVKTISKAVLALVESKKYNLIEAVATDVARICVVRHGVPEVKVIVKKPNSLRFTDGSSVTIVRCFDDFDYQDVHISIGSNVNPLENIPRSIEMLAKKSQVMKLSKAFRTNPEKFYDQADFVNMAVLISTKLDPEGLKLFLHEIEEQLGRKRDPKNKNAPRTIDLDIAFWDDGIREFKLVIGGSSRSWCIPDPDTVTYPHMIVPLADISPFFVHPIEKKTLAVMAEQITGKKSYFFPTVGLHIKNQQRLDVNHDECTATNGLSMTQVNGLNPPEPISHVVLITGASQRIGAAIARHFHNIGYNIVVHYNSSERQASELVKELNSVRANSAYCLQANLKTDIQKTSVNLLRQAVALWGRLDVLVNNASIYHPTVIGNVNEVMWNDLIQTNLAAPFFLSQAAYPSLKTSSGCIINLVDIHAIRPLTDHSVYCISKAGLHMSTLAMSKDFAPYVRVNGVAPGAILWPNDKVLSTDEINTQKETLEKIPMGQLGKPKDIALAIEYLVCHAGYVTGQVLKVDGGRVLNQ